ncbi:DMT family transporter [Acidocella sp.]|uniref:DMT family transporter n=1 Tax=Acidocella sp. TaxID=50710 RepID=UPI002630BE6B|nr:DMT family transporter [Acidocella sp.]
MNPNSPAQTESASSSPPWLRAAPVLFLLFWSAGFPVSKIGIQYAAPFTFLVLRYALALLVLIPCAIWLRPPLPKRWIAWLHAAVVGFCIQTVYFGMCYAAFSRGISAGVVALVVSLQPILVGVLAPALVGEKIGAKGWVGLGLGFCGAVVTILGYGETGHISPWGLLFSFGALFGMAGATLYEKRFGTFMHPVTSNMVQYAVGLVTTLPVASTDFRVDVTTPFIVTMTYLVIANSLVAISLYIAMLRFGRASQVSTLFYLVPPISGLMAWALLDEAMPLMAWVGMAVAGLGVALVRRQRNSV